MSGFWRRGPGRERWLVVDVESSGLDARRDRLLAIGAVAVRSGPRLRLLPGDSFETVLRQPAGDAAPDRDNILVHGIGVGEQRSGSDPASALAAFESFAAGAPLLAFHASFDRALLDRAARQHLGRRLTGPWVDVAALAPALLPGVGAGTLDEWLVHFGIDCPARHRAAADAWATAELLQRLWPRLLNERSTGFRSLQRLAGGRRWIGG